MRAITKLLGAAAAVALTAGVATSANAAVYIAINTGGAPVAAPDADPLPDSAAFVGSVGVFSANIVSGDAGLSPFVLQSNTLDTTATGAGSLFIYVTRTDITGNPGTFKSGFTTNFLPVGWTVTEETFVDDSNTAFGTANLVGSKTFVGVNPSPGLEVASAIGSAPVTGLYSVTHKYSITATGRGSNNSTISLQAVPEPGTWALMIMGFGAAGAMLRTRRRQAAFA